MISIRTEKMGLFLLEISHAIFLSFSLLGHIPIFHTPLKSLTLLAIGLLITNFLLQYKRFLRHEIMWYGGLLLLSLAHSFFSENFGFFKLMLFAGSMRKINFKEVIKFDMWLRLVLIVLVYILCIVGIAPDDIHMHEGIMRHSMGFTNPNTLGIAVFGLVCDILYISDFKLNIKTIVSVTVISTWLYSIARCRTATYVIVFMMIIATLYNINPRLLYSKVAKTIMYAGPIVLGIVTIAAVNGYMERNDIAMQLNEMLSGRIKSIANFVGVLQPTLLGQPIHETVDKTLDNTFAFVWYDLGIAVTITFLAAYFRLIKKNININTKVCIIIFSFIIYGINEHLWINVDYNIFMLAFCANPLLEIRQNKEKLKKKRRLKLPKIRVGKARHSLNYI